MKKIRLHPRYRTLRVTASKTARSLMTNKHIKNSTNNKICAAHLGSGDDNSGDKETKDLIRKDKNVEGDSLSAVQQISIEPNFSNEDFIQIHKNQKKFESFTVSFNEPKEADDNPKEKSPGRQQNDTSSNFTTKKVMFNRESLLYNKYPKEIAGIKVTKKFLLMSKGLSWKNNDSDGKANVEKKTFTKSKPSAINKTTDSDVQAISKCITVVEEVVEEKPGSDEATSVSIHVENPVNICCKDEQTEIDSDLIKNLRDAAEENENQSSSAQVSKNKWTNNGLLLVNQYNGNSRLSAFKQANCKKDLKNAINKNNNEHSSPYEKKPIKMIRESPTNIGYHNSSQNIANASSHDHIRRKHYEVPLVIKSKPTVNENGYDHPNNSEIVADVKKIFRKSSKINDSAAPSKRLFISKIPIYYGNKMKCNHTINRKPLSIQFPAESPQNQINVINEKRVWYKTPLIDEFYRRCDSEKEGDDDVFPESNFQNKSKVSFQGETFKDEEMPIKTNYDGLERMREKEQLKTWFKESNKTATNSLNIREGNTNQDQPPPNYDESKYIRSFSNKTISECDSGTDSNPRTLSLSPRETFVREMKVIKKLCPFDDERDVNNQDLKTKEMKQQNKSKINRHDRKSLEKESFHEKKTNSRHSSKKDFNKTLKSLIKKQDAELRNNLLQILMEETEKKMNEYKMQSQLFDAAPETKKKSVLKNAWYVLREPRKNEVHHGKNETKHDKVSSSYKNSLPDDAYPCKKKKSKSHILNIQNKTRSASGGSEPVTLRKEPVKNTETKQMKNFIEKVQVYKNMFPIEQDEETKAPPGKTSSLVHQKKKSKRVVGKNKDSKPFQTWLKNNIMGPMSNEKDHNEIFQNPMKLYEKCRVCSRKGGTISPSRDIQACQSFINDYGRSESSSSSNNLEMAPPNLKNSYVYQAFHNSQEKKRESSYYNDQFNNSATENNCYYNEQFNSLVTDSSCCDNHFNNSAIKTSVCNDQFNNSATENACYYNDQHNNSTESTCCYGDQFHNSVVNTCYTDQFNNSTVNNYCYNDDQFNNSATANINEVTTEAFPSNRLAQGKPIKQNLYVNQNQETLKRKNANKCESDFYNRLGRINRRPMTISMLPFNEDASAVRRRPIPLNSYHRSAKMCEKEIFTSPETIRTSSDGSNNINYSSNNSVHERRNKAPLKISQILL
ncbi:hypothetical protein HELRODRAFT_178651 [Helobdella robusta]|uniref:Uncharacterized protein n=1 Tax=Helobdella robusta TaxID=6412 RepID=T1FDI3_HELRO|nr:hypothetical protein HELRODRAFT_178651 [Helobdella robusta]ESN96851.1 hypothetical protein HELRODRAFT_178651 [Helobdella robusta]